MSGPEGKMQPREPEEWLDVIEKVLDAEIDSDEAIHLSAEDLTVDVPLSYGDDYEQAKWRFNGDVTVSVDGMRGTLAAWLKLWLDDVEEPAE